MNKNNRKIITILSIFTIIFTLMGGTLAYWTWTSDTHTGVAFTIDKDFSCSADGGGNITPANISLEPTTCGNTSSAIKREIKVTPDIKKNGIEISMDLWLNINNIDTPLSDSVNLRYVLTTSGESCDKGTIISSGNFNGKKTGDKVVIMEKNYTADANETYYLYIWLDKLESNSNTMNQIFDFSLGGICSNYLGQPEAPVLDPGMIPVKIADNGDVTIVSEDDPGWYNYENKQWANIVLVEEEGAGETNSHTREYYQDPANVGKPVTEEDILAYYVWIPRYKYITNSHKKCSELENVNFEDMESYSECYAPYSLTEQEKEKITDYLVEYFGVSDRSFIINEVNRSLETAAFIFGNPIQYYVNEYNMEHAYDYENDKMDPSLQITLETNGFNGDNLIVKQYEDPDYFDIIFESSDDVIKLGNGITEYRTHPAFWWNHNNNEIVDNKEILPGIWVGKFNSNPEKDNVCYNSPSSDNCNNLTQNPTILPDDNKLIYQNISNKFYTSKNMSKEGNIYGLNNETINAHMMKNRDWGAVTYLIYSKYGTSQNLEESKNYGTSSTYPQSTTGNISGIFGMDEIIYVMGYGGKVNESSSSDGLFLDDFSEVPTSKYYDFYKRASLYSDAYGYYDSAELCTIDECAGHALYEHGNLYQPDEFPAGTDDIGVNLFVANGLPWFLRSIKDNRIIYAGFYGREDEYSWRSVLVPGFGD